MANLIQDGNSSTFVAEETTTNYSLLFISFITKLNEEGIQQFRRSKIAKEQDVSSITLFEKSLSEIRRSKRHFHLAGTSNKASDAPNNKSGGSTACNNNSSNNFPRIHHDYEQSDLISWKDLPVAAMPGFLTNIESLRTMRLWTHMAETILLHNLALVTLSKELSSRECNSLSEQGLYIKGQDMLKLCLEMCNKNVGAEDKDSLPDELLKCNREGARASAFQLWYQTLLSQVEASANYLMGLTIFKSSCSRSFSRSSVGTSHGTQLEHHDCNGHHPRNKKRRKVIHDQQSSCSKGDDTINVSEHTLKQCMDYLLNGLNATNQYQMCLIKMGSPYYDDYVDTTSIPIGLFYLLGQIFYELQMHQDSRKAFRKCSWLVDSRQKQILMAMTTAEATSIAPIA